MTSSYKPPTFEGLNPQTMIKTLSTVFKAQHHKLQSLAVDKKQLLGVPKEILTAIDPELESFQTPEDDRKIDETISKFFDNVTGKMLEPFLIFFETEDITLQDLEKGKRDFIKRLHGKQFLGEENSTSIIKEWIHIANVSIGTEKVESNYEMEYLTPHNPRYWRKGIRIVKGKEDPLSNFYPCVVEYKEQQYASIEHAYQTAKLKHLRVPQRFVEMANSFKTGSEVKRYVQEIIRSSSWEVKRRQKSWDYVKIELMKELLELKWEACQEFVDHLKQTGHSTISHPVKDMFWGNGSEVLDQTCDGADFFSILLTQMRDTKMTNKVDWVIPKRHEQKYSQFLKIRDWALPSLDKNIGIVGDSNLGRIPPFVGESCQIECYPGAKICNITHMIQGYRFPEHLPDHLIISVGINDATSMSKDIVQDMEKLVHTVKETFSKSRVYFVPVQVDDYHFSSVQNLAKKINENAHAMEVLELLGKEKFHTEKDNIHWKAHTAKWMVKKWLSELK